MKLKGKKRSKKKIVIIALIILTIIRILLALRLPTGMMVDQAYDDQLLYKYAMSLARFHWLGGYNQLTLAKGISYSVFLMICNLSFIPYKLGLILLYIGSIITFCIAIRPKLYKNYIYIIYILLLYSPVMFTSLIAQRMYRNAILPSSVIYVFSCYIGLFFRKELPIKKLIPWIVGSSLSLLFFWHIKEDSIWILPFICTISVLLVIYWIINKKEKILPKILLLLIPFAVLFSFNQVYSFINYKLYGVYAVSDKSGANFGKMIGKLMSIKDDKLNDNVWITKSMLYKAYKVSPTLKILKPTMEDCKAWTADDGEVGGDLIIWKFRVAMEVHGFFQTGKTANDFCKKVNKELDKAFKKGELKKDTRIRLSSQMRGIDGKDISKALSVQYDWYKEFCIYKRNVAGMTYSTGDKKDVIKVADFTQVTPYFSENKYSTRPVEISNAIISIYQKGALVINIIAYISFVYMIITTVMGVIKKKYEDLDITIVAIGIILCVLLTLVEVSLFLSYLSTDLFVQFRDFYAAHGFSLVQMFKYLCMFFAIQKISTSKLLTKRKGKTKMKDSNIKEFIQLLIKMDFKKLFKTKTDNTIIQFFRYVFVGGFAAVVNIGMLYVFTDVFKIYYVVSNILSFTLGLIVNYILSKKFVFQDEVSINKSKEFVIYAIIGVIGLGLDTFFIWLFTEVVALYYMGSKILSTAIVFIWNFGARKVLYKIIK